MLAFLTTRCETLESELKFVLPTAPDGDCCMSHCTEILLLFMTFAFPHWQCGQPRNLRVSNVGDKEVSVGG